MIHIEASSVEAAVSSTLPVAAVWLATALAPAIVLIVCLGLAPAFGPPRRSRSSVASAKQPDSEVLKVVESATAAAAVATAAPFQRASEVAETASAVQRLLEDDRYLVAEPLLQRLQATAVSGGAPARASARALSQLPASLPAATVLQRCVEARAALASICGAAGWRLVASTERESPAVPRSSTFLKREAGLMWSKTVAQLAVPAVDACAVVRESQLFKTWRAEATHAHARIHTRIHTRAHTRRHKHRAHTHARTRTPHARKSRKPQEQPARTRTRTRAAPPPQVPVLCRERAARGGGTRRGPLPGGAAVRSKYLHTRASSNPRLIEPHLATMKARGAQPTAFFSPSPLSLATPLPRSPQPSSPF